jgi:adenine-specific DNA-methyltransferase
MALARARVMGARYRYYLLADSRDGQIKEAQITGRAAMEAPTHGSIRQGFVYERASHITLGSIANNTEIDVIWDECQPILEPLRERLNAALKKSWQEWEIPREAEKAWPRAAKDLHTEWWEQRIARQKKIDASIAAKADFEYRRRREFRRAQRDYFGIQRPCAWYSGLSDHDSRESSRWRMDFRPNKSRNSTT